MEDMSELRLLRLLEGAVICQQKGREFRPMLYDPKLGAKDDVVVLVEDVLAALLRLRSDAGRHIDAGAITGNSTKVG